MKKAILTAGMMLTFMAVAAQQTANDYIVKTKGAKKTAVTEQAGAADGQQAKEAEKAHDFISDNFRFYSLCDWQEDMKFMVMPEKYDMVVKTFRSADTGKEVSSMTLRYKIMLYKGHTEGPDGHARINFLCQDNDQMYYYEVPNGSFEDYCYGKMGVPTLAYLGDVDIAREKLMGKTMFTKTDLFRVDTEYDGDGFQEVKVPKNEEVKVTAIGVGTRSYPVKIIVEDRKGNEFYQNVAISKTNSGMRDDEFIMDNTKYLFGGSFELQDANMSVAQGYAKYLGQDVHTKQTTNMVMKKEDGTESTVRMPRMSSFTIEALTPKSNTTYVTLTLKAKRNGIIYHKDVTFENVNVVGDIDGQREDYFNYLFATGASKADNSSPAVRKAIEEGRVITGMTEDEVIASVGEPDQRGSASSGRHDWHYNRVNGKLLTVHFNGAGKVIGINGNISSGKRPTTTRRNTNTTARRR